MHIKSEKIQKLINEELNTDFSKFEIIKKIFYPIFNSMKLYCIYKNDLFLVKIKNNKIAEISKIEKCCFEEEYDFCVYLDGENFFFKNVIIIEETTRGFSIKKNFDMNFGNGEIYHIPGKSSFYCDFEDSTICNEDMVFLKLLNDDFVDKTLIVKLKNEIKK